MAMADLSVLCSVDEQPEMDPEADCGMALDCEETGEGEGEGGLNTNYDSCDGAIPVHRCDRCENYETLSGAALEAHMAQCPGAADGDNSRQCSRKMFECDVCNMKFSNGANMRRHKMRHTGVKPYECRVCQKRFFRKDHLAEHFTTHTKTLPFHCPICNRGFQRQIAMRAHFQNEHVGQHDMIKSCPLCSYRAGSMKSLRVHFFNRHGIDLDNPGPTPVAGCGGAGSGSGGGEGSVSGGACSDSGDSTGGNRSADNATPPMHFLTPHVEISMTDTPPSPPQSQENGDTLPMLLNGGSVSGSGGEAVVDGAPDSPLSGDSGVVGGGGGGRPETDVKPSVSLIPIQQEPEESGVGAERRPPLLRIGGEGLPAAEPPRLTSTLIKVSPLKSLLRDDLKRRGTAITVGRARSDLSPPIGPGPNPLTITATGEPYLYPDWRSPPLKHPAVSLQCVFCGIGFPNQTLYFFHKGCHSESNPWKCNICGEQCCNVYDFNSHLLSKSHQ